MRIAFLSCDPDVQFGDGRACPARLRGLAHACARAGHQATVICAGLEPGSDDPAPEITIRSLRSPVSVREIDWHYSRVQPDLVIERLCPGSLDGALAASEAGIPHLYDAELAARMPGLSTSLSVRGALPEALALSRGAIVSTERTATRVRTLMGEQYPVGVVPNAASAEFLVEPSPDHVGRIEQLLRLQARRPHVAFFGSLDHECGLLPLVRSLGTIAEAKRPRVLVIGDGPERNAALIAADDAGVGLVLCGRVPHRDAPAHLALSDIVVVSGDDAGGAPQALIEAMAMECAVVAPECEAVMHTVHPGHDACVVPFGDVDALAGTLEALLADAPRRRKLGTHARRTIESRHTWDARVSTLEAITDRVRAEVSESDHWQSEVRANSAAR